MIYLNCAATSYPKPESVIRVLSESFSALPSGQYRGADIPGNDDIFQTCKKRIAQILGIKDADRIYFTCGATEGLNCIISGLELPARAFVTTATEHNSVLRPLYNLGGGSPTVVPCDGQGLIAPTSIENAITRETRAVIVNQCSNVTGAIQDVKRIGEIVHDRGLLYIVDCSQSAGCLEVKADEWNVDALAFTGHKSILGPQGTGGFYIKKGLNIKPLKYGGTGRDSTILRYGNEGLEYEAGTQNSAGIAALSEAASFILEKGVSLIHSRENELAAYLIQGLEQIKGVHIYGRELPDRGPMVSVGISGIKCSDAAYILQNGYGIITRAGLMCAPLIHSNIGSGIDGVLRLSFSDSTEKQEIDEALKAIADIAYSAATFQSRGKQT